MVRPDKWWKERSIIARSLIYKKKYETAYKITSQTCYVEKDLNLLKLNG